MDFITSYSKSLNCWLFNQPRSLDNISIDLILEDTTHSPISLNDFRFFLKHKEQSIHCLEFYFWYLDYKERFAALSEKVKELSPPPKAMPSSESYNLSLVTEKTVENTNKLPQPFRQEIDTVIQTFFHNSDPSIQSLYDVLPGFVIQYIQHHSSLTTHPDVFLTAHEMVYSSLKNKSLVHFIHDSLGYLSFSYVLLYYALSLGSLLATILFADRISRVYHGILFFLFMFGLLSGRSAFSAFCDVVEITNNSNDLESQVVTSMIDPMVCKYNKKMMVHIWSTSVMFSLVMMLLQINDFQYFYIY